MVHRGLGWRRDVRHNDASTSLWIFLLAVRLLQTVKKGESVALCAPPNLAALIFATLQAAEKKHFKNVCVCGAVRIPCSASAATKKCAPLRGFAFFCCAKPLQCKMRVVWRDVRHKGRSLHGQHFDRFHPSFNLRGRAKASRLARRRTLRQYAFGAHL